MRSLVVRESEALSSLSGSLAPARSKRAEGSFEDHERREAPFERRRSVANPRLLAGRRPVRTASGTARRPARLARMSIENSRSLGLRPRSRYDRWRLRNRSTPAQYRRSARLTRFARSPRPSSARNCPPRPPRTADRDRPATAGWRPQVASCATIPAPPDDTGAGSTRPERARQVAPAPPFSNE